jgi:hypothetical protein
MKRTNVQGISARELVEEEQHDTQEEALKVAPR